MTVKVAITGPLSRPRKQIAELIEGKTDAQFSPGVTYDTNYLVASRFDTNKAKRAAKLGVRVISETEMLAFIAEGRFPTNEKANPTSHGTAELSHRRNHVARGN